MENVAVIGASTSEDRFSNKAMRLLAEKGHNPIPVAPGQEEILGRKVYPALSGIPERIDTVTMYLGAQRQDPVIDDVLQRKPRRVIFNPGAENPAAYERLRDTGITVIET